MYGASFAPQNIRSGVIQRQSSSTALSSTAAGAGFGQATELPDSLDDSAILAAQGCVSYMNDAGPMQRCRVDFDTSIGDETYTTLKSSTEFMQKFVTALCYETIPGVQEMRQNEMMALVQAKVELSQIYAEEGISDEEDGDELQEETSEEEDQKPTNPRIEELRNIIFTV